MQAVCLKAGQTLKEGSGYAKPYWVINEETGKWEEANNETFPCPTQKIFITSGYSAIDATIDDDTFFIINVLPNQLPPNDSDFYCHFIAHGESKPGISSARKLQDKELIQVLEHPLPDPNNPTFQLQIPVLTNFVCLEHEKSIYGIFEQKSFEDALSVQTISLSIINSPLLSQGRYSKALVKFNRNDISESDVLYAVVGERRLTFVVNIIELIKSTKGERHEFMSNVDILKAGGDVLEKTSPQAFKKAQIQLYQKNLANSKLSSLRPVLDKFFQVINEIDAESEENAHWIEKILSSERGKAILEKVLVKEPVILKEYAAAEYNRLQVDIEGKVTASRERLRDLEAKIKETEVQLGDLNRRLQVAETEKTDNSAKDVKQMTLTLNAEIKSAQETLSGLQSQLEERRKELATYDRAKDIEESIRNREVIREHIGNEIKDREERKAQVEQALAAQEYELKKKLFEMKPYVEALTGFTPEASKPSSGISVKIEALPVNAKTALDKRDRLIEGVVAHLQKEGRNLKRHDVANLLITSQQSFITILAGLPGAGKTSLVRLLAEALSLEPRLLEISVGRGWTSSRDLIGYFNPLVGKFQGAPTGFYNFAMETKGDTFKASPNSYVLLDEANLSPIEHYWSAFMSMSDSPDRRFLHFGTETIALPKNLRFFGTINYDNTTEPLSPRMIDRAAVISLDTSNGFENVSMEEDGESLPTEVYSTDVMEQWFGLPSSEVSLNRNDASILDEIDRVCGQMKPGEGKPIVLSHRKKTSIQNFCKQAYPIMRTESDSLAVDLAVCQQILPLVDGQGDSYRQRLTSLLGVLEKYKLDRSTRMLERIVDFGRQDLDSFSFFAF